MGTLLTLYFVTLSLELVLSLTMLTLLWLILAPRGAGPQRPATEPERRAPQLARTPDDALRMAFQTVSRGRDETAVLVHARHMLAQLGEPEQ